MKWTNHYHLLILLCLIVSLCDSFVIPRCFKRAELKNPQRYAPYKPTRLIADSLRRSDDRIMSSKHFSAVYNKLLLQYPFPTKMITSGVVGGIGDVLVQFLNCWSMNRSFHLDIQRLSVFVAVSTFYIAPIIHFWFNLLERITVPQVLLNYFRESKSIKPLYMLLLDQTFGAAFISAGFFFAFEIAQSFLSQNAGTDTMSKAFQAGYDMNRRLLWRTLVINWYCWPIINFLNFRFIPIQYRYISSNLMTFTTFDI